MSRNPDNAFWVGHILLPEASLLADLGRVTESAAKLADRQAVTEQIAADISDIELRQSFLAVSEARMG